MNEYNSMLINFLKHYFSIKKIINIFFIFVVGFVSRLIVNQTFDINVFTDCLNFISILYYFFLSYFICIIRDIFSETGLSKIIVPNKILNIPRSACIMVDKNTELNGDVANINSYDSPYN